MKVLKTLVVALGVTLWLPLSARSAEDPAQTTEGAAAAPKCLEAVVNPVTRLRDLCQSPRGPGRPAANRILQSSLQAPRT